MKTDVLDEFDSVIHRKQLDSGVDAVTIVVVNEAIDRFNHVFRCFKPIEIPNLMLQTHIEGLDVAILSGDATSFATDRTLFSHSR